MSTITRRPRSHDAPPSPTGHFPDWGDRRIVIRGVGRHVYQCLSEAIGEGQHVRLVYDGKDLELMVTGHTHEHFKDILNDIVKAVTLALGIDYGSCGEATWNAEEADRGLQADLSYYFDAGKIRAWRAAIARNSMDPADYPGPDLAVEIDISRPKVDRSVIYAALGVVEVWRFDGKNLIIEYRQADGSYAPVEASRFLHIEATEIRRWLVDEDSTRPLIWARRLNQWALGLSRGIRPGRGRTGASPTKRKTKGNGK